MRTSVATGESRARRTSFGICCLLAVVISASGARRASTGDADRDLGAAAHRRASASCLVVDTDVGLDDFRAMAVLLPARRIDAVVVTEGIASVERGRTAMALFLASGGSTAPVFAGETAESPHAYDWLPEARTGAERINGFMAEAIPTATATRNLRSVLPRALRGCRRIDVLLLAPWSSFVQYAPRLQRRLGRLVVSGRPLAENDPDNFNCVYDQPACNRADRFSRILRRAVWVDLPSDPAPHPSYAPTEPMVARLNGTGLPGLLQAALQLDPSQWLDTRLWDDSAALYLIAPEDFETAGKHLEPAIDEDDLRNRLVEAINGKAVP